MPKEEDKMDKFKATVIVDDFKEPNIHNKEMKDRLEFIKELSSHDIKPESLDFVKSYSTGGCSGPQYYKAVVVYSLEEENNFAAQGKLVSLIEQKIKPFLGSLNLTLKDFFIE